VVGLPNIVIAGVLGSEVVGLSLSSRMVDGGVGTAGGVGRSSRDIVRMKSRVQKWVSRVAVEKGKQADGYQAGKLGR